MLILEESTVSLGIAMTSLPFGASGDASASAGFGKPGENLNSDRRT